MQMQTEQLGLQGPVQRCLQADPGWQERVTEAAVCLEGPGEVSMRWW